MKRLTSLVVLCTAALLISPTLYAQRGMAGGGGFRGGGGGFHSGGGFRSAPSGGFRSLRWAGSDQLRQAGSDQQALQVFVPLPADSDRLRASAHLVHGLPAFHLLLQVREHSHRGPLYPATMSL